jgi:hypothetical protein
MKPETGNREPGLGETLANFLDSGFISGRSRDVSVRAGLAFVLDMTRE